MEKILKALINDPDFEWLIIYSRHIKVRPHASGVAKETKIWSVQKGAQRQNTSCRGCEWYADQISCSADTVADCTQACTLIRGICVYFLFGDRGYDSDQIVEYTLQVGMSVVIPPSRNRKEQRDYDQYLYKLRHLVEPPFILLKQWRGIATRYAKYTSSFVATVQICCIAIWVAVLA